jgi:hypothetical protein
VMGRGNKYGQMGQCMKGIGLMGDAVGRGN